MYKRQICDGTIYDFYGQNVTTTGIYETILKSTNNCDSLLIVQSIKVLFPDTAETVEVLLCEGDQFVFGDLTVTSAGLYPYLDKTDSENTCGTFREFLIEIGDAAVPLVANPDTIAYKTHNENQVVNLLTNDDLPTSNQLELNILAASPSAIITPQNGRVLYRNTEETLLKDSFVYEICLVGTCEKCDTAMVFVIIENTCQERAITLLPKAFSPNSEISDNRIFDPLAAFQEAACFFPNEALKLVILNRWKEVIYETTDDYEPWDGRNEKTKQTYLPNAYFYIFQYGPDKGQRIRGIINLVDLE